MAAPLRLYLNRCCVNQYRRISTHRRCSGSNQCDEIVSRISHDFGRTVLRSCQRPLSTGGQFEDDSFRSGTKSNQWRNILAGVGIAVIGGAVAGLYIKSQVQSSFSTAYAATKEQPSSPTGTRRPDLPDYHYDEVAEHASPDTRIWVTFRGGVYDITDFMPGHPGGTEKISMAIGGSLEPFWQLYGVHKTDHVLEILEKMRIGNVHEDDLKKEREEGGNSKGDNYYANEPKRHPALKINVSNPFNAETPARLLTDSYLTPNELFFVRNHLPVPPDVRGSGNPPSVEISGVSLGKPLSFTVEDLKKKFKVHKITSSVQCAGNRRSDMHKSKEVRGIQWGTAAVSTAEWTGVKLADVLAYIGVKEDQVKHVLFQGQDRDIEGLPYEASVPAETAFDPRKDVLLAFEMNGKEIPRDHGYPLRVIVPGTIGARQVKWLQKIILDTEESQSFWQQKDYKTLNPSTDWDSTDLSKSMPIQEYPVQSAICEPSEGAKLTLAKGEGLKVRGYALSGGGRGILRVDVSLDGGKTWHEAKLSRDTDQKTNQQWAWTLWEVTLPWSDLIAANLVRGKSSEMEIICKATDTSHNTQPETDDGIWNMRGLLENKWHRIHVHVSS